MPRTKGLSRLLSPKELADILGVTPATLERWRVSGDGPKFVKLGNRAHSPVRYRVEDVQAFIAAQERSSTSDDGAGGFKG